ncbi:MAG: hypothetical protein A3J10_00485 [Candidatus Sungbacteria bacterium RIFCSPLOWO2_02_FULL_54_10]|nr:MAG: hypothetical protein A3J10_00485 [Candidatus Sungbacteria bacterium RIFCSPLOWO2_02_FULL_54_10]
MRHLGTRNILLLILVGAVVVRLLLFGYLFFQDTPEFFVLGDSNGYLRIAHNLIEGNGYSQFTELPHLPDSMRVPGFPAMLAVSIGAFGSYIPIVLLQILFAAVLVFLTYRIALLVSGNERGALIAAALMAFEPYSVFISTSVLTETTFALLLACGAYAALRFLQEPGIGSVALSSVFFGAAALVRPIGEFLPLVLVPLVFLRVPARAYLKYLALAVVPFLIVIGPWLFRNYTTFGVPALSSGGLQNVYSDLGGAIIGVRDNIPTPEAKQQLEEDFVQRHNIVWATLQTDLSNGPAMFKEGIGIMLSNPVATIKVLTSISITFFTHDAWTYYLQRWDILPRYEVLFSPSYTLMTEGPIVALRESIAHAGWTLPTALLGRAFWMGISALFFVGIAAMIMRGGRERMYALFLALVVLYLLALSASVGFGINGRFRYPVNSIFFTGAVIGGSLIMNWLKERYARTLTLP